jgi:hypothetical protein
MGDFTAWTLLISLSAIPIISCARLRVWRGVSACGWVCNGSGLWCHTHPFPVLYVSTARFVIDEVVLCLRPVPVNTTPCVATSEFLLPPGATTLLFLIVNSVCWPAQCSDGLSPLCLHVFVPYSVHDWRVVRCPCHLTPRVVQAPSVPVSATPPAPGAGAGTASAGVASTRAATTAQVCVGFCLASCDGAIGSCGVRSARWTAPWKGEG